MLKNINTLETILVFKVSFVVLHRSKKLEQKKMREKIISKATEMFLKLGFKSVTMDDIANEMCISKKTIYKYFCNKEVLIDEGTTMVHKEMHNKINHIVSQNYNAIAENFAVRSMFKEMFQSTDKSPVYQLKKYYPEIYQVIMMREIEECKQCFTSNITKGISEGLYRKDVPVSTAVQFYYTLLFSINETTPSEKEVFALEFLAMEYHIRAIATEEGIIELDKNINLYKNNNP
jgi:TetR/AcrR family transcriptional regulator, biofilm operon repressor